jgi:hypothetical protein
MKYLSLILVLIVACAHAQDGDVVFTVKAKSDVYLYPSVDTLLAGREYQFKLMGVDAKIITKAVFARGKVRFDGTAISIKPDSVSNRNGLDTLHLYTEKDGLTTKLLSKKFTIIPLPDVNADTGIRRGFVAPAGISVYWYSADYFMARSNQISLSRIKAAVKNKVSAKSFSDSFKFYVKIGGFKMDISCNGNTQSYASVGEGLSPQMQQAIANIKQGCIIRIYDVQCLGFGPSNDMMYEGPFIITVTP